MEKLRLSRVAAIFLMLCGMAFILRLDPRQIRAAQFNQKVDRILMVVETLGRADGDGQRPGSYDAPVQAQQQTVNIVHDRWQSAKDILDRIQNEHTRAKGQTNAGL